jgi:hypothetical protein
MFQERIELPTEGAGVLLAQVDLEFRTAKCEAQGLCRRAAIEIVLKQDSYLLSHCDLR